MYKTYYIDTQIDIYFCKRSCYIFITHIILLFTISHLFFLQLWLNNKADWTLLLYSGNQFMRRKSVFKTTLKRDRLRQTIMLQIHQCSCSCSICGASLTLKRKNSEFQISLKMDGLRQTILLYTPHHCCCVCSISCAPDGP